MDTHCRHFLCTFLDVKNVLGLLRSFRSHLEEQYATGNEKGELPFSVGSFDPGLVL